MKRIRISPFGPKDPLTALDCVQAAYLRCYLSDMGCKTVVEEPVYFDRDYLSEFSAFYGTSTRGYSNRCRRIHFFGLKFQRATLREALKGDEKAVQDLQESYMGFAVLRPIAAAPLGRTVLRWYPEQTPTRPRVVSSRAYTCHLAGLPLTVEGLAWQQQDSGVGACATVALWSMLHSSALDDSCAIPTTASITEAAHRTASMGDRVFPSTSLKFPQMLEAIKELGLAPAVVDGDLKAGSSVDGDPEKTRVIDEFSAERFSVFSAAMIRSGYPVLLFGSVKGAGHAVCLVGFREAQSPSAAAGALEMQDATTPFFYVHDDNRGPNIRFEVQSGVGGRVELVPSAPTPLYSGPLLPDPVAGYGPIVPHALICAVHRDLRLSPLELHRAGRRAAGALQRQLVNRVTTQNPGLTLSTRFARVADYLSRDLAGVLGEPSRALGAARFGLVERVPPMSLRIGVVRIGIGQQPLLDVLFDTSDSDRQLLRSPTDTGHAMTDRPKQLPVHK
jgi:hypothetical protein